MTETLVDRQPADSQELAKQVRSHPFVDGPPRKLVRFLDPTRPPTQPNPLDSVDQAAG